MLGSLRCEQIVLRRISLLDRLYLCSYRTAFMSGSKSILKSYKSLSKSLKTDVVVPEVQESSHLMLASRSHSVYTRHKHYFDSLSRSRS